MSFPVAFEHFWIVSCLLVCVTGQWNTLDFMKREHSLVKPYQSSGMGLQHWDFIGSTMLTNNFVRLTPDRQSKTGAIWNNVEGSNDEEDVIGCFDRDERNADSDSDSEEEFLDVLPDKYDDEGGANNITRVSVWDRTDSSVPNASTSSGSRSIDEESNSPSLDLDLNLVDIDLPEDDDRDKEHMHDWCKNVDNFPLVPPFTGSSSFQAEMTDEEITPLQFYSLLVMSGIVKFFKSETSKYAQSIIKDKMQSNRNLSPRLICRTWETVTESEIFSFIAILLHVGLVKKNFITDYWSTDITITTPFASQVMERERFRSVFSFFHISDNATFITRGQPDHDPLHKIRPLYDHLRKPCFVQNWEMHIQFKVHGGGKTLFGDGFAVWYTKDRMKLGEVFGSVDPFIGLAIFLDTYSNHNGAHNHNHPYVSGMVSNGTMNYDHDSDGTHTQLSGCEAQFRNKDYNTYLAIRYEDNTLTVSVDIDDKSGWKECFSVSGIKLPVGYYFGASAATGDLADNHDIISVKFYELDADPQKPKSPPYIGLPEAAKMEAPREHVDSPKSSFSGWKLLLLIIFLVIVLAGGSVVGFIMYSKQQENSRKRFY